ncbi:MAG: hypothetical protein KDM63_00600 [Verrucomicrobiae bacterium]|nr:hypothetical protein [Verrucomicrobiae bacterium]MCB1090731.1 hypothetical protein [Verrucomicrobiae bacterium]
MKFQFHSPKPFKALLSTSALALALAVLPSRPVQAGHDHEPDLRCLSKTLADDAEALRCSFERELKQAHAYPPRGCDRELLDALNDFKCATGRIAEAIRCGHDFDRVEPLLCSSRKAMEAASHELREVRVCSRTRDQFSHARESLCRFSEAYEDLMEELAHHHHHHYSSTERVIIEEPPQVVQVIRPPSVEEQAVGLILQAIALGLNDNHCRH